MAKIVFPLMGCILLKQSGAPDCFDGHSGIQPGRYRFLSVVVDCHGGYPETLSKCDTILHLVICKLYRIIPGYGIPVLSEFPAERKRIATGCQVWISGDEGMIVSEGMHTVDYILGYLNIGLKFFFITMVFGYFAGHMKQREFKS